MGRCGRCRDARGATNVGQAQLSVALSLVELLVAQSCRWHCRCRWWLPLSVALSLSLVAQAQLALSLVEALVAQLSVALSLVAQLSVALSLVEPLVAQLSVALSLVAHWLGADTMVWTYAIAETAK